MSTFGSGLRVGSTYNFTFIAPSILENSYSAARVLGIVDSDTAQQTEDVIQLHTLVRVLAPDLPSSVEAMEFVKVVTSTGEVRAFAKDWLSAEPVKVTSRSVRFTVLMDLTMISEVVSFFNGRGITNVRTDIQNG